MTRYLVARLWHSVVVLFGVSVVVFALLHLSGDPVRLLLPPEASEADVQRLRHDYGFDQPIYVQYSRFISRAVQGDFGVSLRHNEPGMALVVERLPASFELTAVAMLFSIVIAIPAGVIAALKKNTLIDGISMSVALIGQCVPVFWLGIMLIILFSVQLNLLPPGGRGGVQFLIMPGFTLGAYSAALVTRLTRSSMIDVLVQDYVRTARAKGLSSYAILVRHALKNAAIPIVTVVGMQIGILLGGAVITETVFSYPGMGRLAVQAISNRDFPVVQAFVIVVAVIIVTMNLLVDLAYLYIDPRIKYQRRSA
ncbi:MAG: ABC transporter permease [Chloroflexi bacterium]|nr:ABC transporter permease [Chloroflexota bacterium]